MPADTGAVTRNHNDESVGIGRKVSASIARAPHLARGKAGRVETKGRRVAPGGPGKSNGESAALCGENLDGAGGAEADDVRESDLCPFDLARTGLPTQMRHDLVHVGNPRGAQRMPL